MGDVAVLDETKDVGAANRRQLAALYCGATSGFEVNTTHIGNNFGLSHSESSRTKLNFW